MPFAFHQAGILMGGLQLLLISIITDYSLILMIKCGELSGARSYQVLSNFFISIVMKKKYDSIVLYHNVSFYLLSGNDGKSIWAHWVLHLNIHPVCVSFHWYDFFKILAIIID